MRDRFVAILSNNVAIRKNNTQAKEERLISELPDSASLGVKYFMLSSHL